MKRIHLLTIFFPLLSLGQDIPLGSNVIMASGVTYKQVVNGFLDRNFRIFESDKDFETAAVVSNDHPNIRIELRIKDSTATLKEFVSGYRCYFAAKSDAPAFRRAFLTMDSVVRAISDRIKYEKQ